MKRAELPEVWVGDVVRARELCAGGELVVGRVRGGCPHYRTLTVAGARVVCAWEGVTVLARMRYLSCRRALLDGLTRAADGPIGVLKQGEPTAVMMDRGGDPRSPGDGSSRGAVTVAPRELQGGAGAAREASPVGRGTMEGAT